MNAVLSRSAITISLGLLLAAALTSCETQPEVDEARANTGAAIGTMTGERRDSFTGEPIGAGTDYLIGVLADNRREYADGYYRIGTRYPAATPTNRRGIVRSPYPPGNLVDVRRIPKGQRVVDPSVNRIFINP